MFLKVKKNPCMFSEFKVIRSSKIHSQICKTDAHSSRSSAFLSFFFLFPVSLTTAVFGEAGLEF